MLLPCFRFFYLFCGNAEQRKLSADLLNFRRRQQGNGSVLPVETRAALHLPRAKPTNAFRHAWTGGAGDLFQRRLPQNIKFRPKLVQQPLILGVHPLSGRRPACRSRNNLRKGRKTFKGFCILRMKALRPVGQLLHAMFYADG